MISKDYTSFNFQLNIMDAGHSTKCLSHLSALFGKLTAVNSVLLPEFYIGVPSIIKYQT